MQIAVYFIEIQLGFYLARLASPRDVGKGYLPFRIGRCEPLPETERNVDYIIIIVIIGTEPVSLSRKRE